MQNNKTVAVIGGDSRQLYAAGFLKKKGYDVILYALELANNNTELRNAENLEQAMKADYVILPLPVSKTAGNLNAPFSSELIKLKKISEMTNDRQTVFLGMGSAALKKQLEAKAFKVIDYFRIESLTYKNALLTAEGLISIILDNLPLTINSMKIAVTGYGRVAYFTAKLLHLLGADVSIFARNPLQTAKAETDGLKAYKLSSLIDYADRFTCIINTVPKQIIKKDIINKTKKDCVFIESASSPYGIDSEAISESGRTLIKAFSLPGKTAPETAGYIIGDAVKSIIEEEQCG